MKKQFKLLLSILILTVCLCSLFSCSEDKELQVFFSKDHVTVSSGDELCVVGCGNGTLESTDSKHIDYLILYDFSDSVIGNFDKLSNEYDIENIYIPDYIVQGDEYEAFLDICDQEDAFVIRVEGSMSFAVGDGSVTVFAGMNETYENTNDYSLMTKITLEENRMLLCGSAGEERITEFLLYEKGPYSHINLTQAQRGKEKPLLNSLSPECIVFNNSDVYVDGYEVYDITKGPIIYEG